MSNDLFRFISLRRPSEYLSIDPSEVVGRSAVIEALRDLRIDIDQPSPEVLNLIASFQPIGSDQHADLILHACAKLIAGPGSRELEDIRQRELVSAGVTYIFGNVASLDLFARHFRLVLDSWLVLRLRKENAALADEQAMLLRGGYIAWRTFNAPDSLRPKGAISELAEARVTLPRDWSAATRQQQALHSLHLRLMSGLHNIGEPVRDKELKMKRAKHAELRKQGEDLEAIQSQAHRAYFAIKRDKGLRADQQPDMTSAPFWALLRQKLPVALHPAFDLQVATVGASAHHLDDLLTIFEPPATTSGSANRLCSEIRAIEDTEIQALPTAPVRPQYPTVPLVQDAGWGELVVARERLVGYVAEEIAHIENVLTGEVKLREHERINKTEQIEETETLTEKESERDTQTTDRFELQSASQRTIQQDFSIQAGVNTSGQYGLTEVSTSLDAAFHTSKAQSTSNSTQMAREVVNKSVERVLERVRQRRQVTTTEQIRELNRHKIMNKSGDGQVAGPVSGIYKWVEKIHEIELRQYGKRMMVEFHIPEPGISFLEERTRSAPRRRLPPFDVAPDGIDEWNYLCFAQRYAADVETPPARLVSVGYAWNSTNLEEADAGGEDEASKDIAIPEGYAPVSGEVQVSVVFTSLVEEKTAERDVFVGVGGITAISGSGDNLVAKYGQTNPGVLASEIHWMAAPQWPTGMPVSIRLHGHWDKSAVVQIALCCERTKEALVNWKLSTWQQLKVGYEALSRRVERDVQDAALDRGVLFVIEGRPSAENRARERHELQKWAIKAMRLTSQNFNAAEAQGAMQEVNPFLADMQAPVVRFFEDAFEWAHMSYFLYPYYWARRETWAMRNALQHSDSRFTAFLAAGAARVIVPVTPGYEEKVTYYLADMIRSGGNIDDELARIRRATEATAATQAALSAGDDSPFDSLWAELLLDRKEDSSRGSGTLKVRKDSTTVEVNADSYWDVTQRDMGRELYLRGVIYTVARVFDDTKRFEIDRPYQDLDDDAALYVTGSLPFGAPWRVRLPTSLVVLHGASLPLI